MVRELTASEWGGYAFVMSLLGILGLVVDFQVGRIVLAEVLDSSDAQTSRLVGSYTCFRVLIGTLVLVLGVVIVVLGSYSSEVAWATVVAGIGMVFMAPTYGLIIWFQAKIDLAPIAWARTIGAVVQLVLIVGLAVSTRLDLMTVVVAFAVGQAVVLLVHLWAVRAAGLRLLPALEPARWWMWLKQSFPLAIGFGLATLYFKLDVVLLGRLDSLEAVGQYGIGYKFADLALFIPPALLTPVMTVMVASWPNDLVAFRRHFRQSFVLLVVAATGLSVGFALAARPLVLLLYGERYAPSIGAARVLVIAAALQFLTQLWFVALVAVGRNRAYAVAGLVGVVVNLALNLVLIPRHSFDGAAAATVVTEVFVLAVLVIAAARPTPIAEVPWPVVAASVLSCAAMTVLYLGVEIVAPWWVATATSAAAFAAVLHLAVPGGVRALADNARFEFSSAPASALDPE